MIQKILSMIFALVLLGQIPIVVKGAELPLGPPKIKVNPRIAVPSLGSDDVIVYISNVMDFGADSTGSKDSTKAFQDAINLAEEAGGGQVFAPPGIYRLDGTLNLPQGITLRGEWKNPDEGGLGKGTILAAYANKNNAEGQPMVTMHSAATVKDLTVWWPEQNVNNVSEYPFAFEGSSDTSDTVNAMNITFINAYNGIKVFHGHGCITIRNIYGTVLNIGITEDKGFDIGRIENIYFDSTYWANSGLAGAPSVDAINAYTREHTIGIDMFQDDWGYLYNLNFRNMLIGLQFGHGNCAVSNMTTDNVNIAINVNRVSYPGLQVANSNLKANVGKNPVCIKYDTDASGKEQISVAGTTFSGTPATAIRVRGPVNPVLSLQDCVFTDWGYGDGTYAIDMENGSAIIMNSQFQKQGKAIRLGADVNGANILGCEFNGQPQIDNHSSNTIIDHTPVDMPKTPEYSYTFAPIFKPKVIDKLFSVTESPYNAAVNGTTDDTAAIQKALDAAKAAGGGTVYMPAGYYRMDGGVTIPEGVQLRGSFDAPHVGKVMSGTVVYAYGGKGNENATPVFSVSANAGIRGITVFHPEQGNKEDNIVAYPWVVRGLGENASVVNMCFVNAYNGIDMMTYRCDNSVIADMNAQAHNIQVQVGKGANGGWLQDVHFNPCNLTQSRWPISPGSSKSYTPLETYCALYTIGFKLGAISNYNNFQNFTILVKNPILMVEEPEGSYSGIIHGFAFDANEIGLDIEQAGNVSFINPMNVSNLNGGGPNIRTGQDFTGVLNYFNGDAWGGNTQICEVNGGTVNLMQYSAWCAANAKVNAGVLNMYGTKFMHEGSSGADCIYGENIESARLIGSIGFPKTNVINYAGDKVVMENNLNNDGSVFGEKSPLDNVKVLAIKSEATGKYASVDSGTGLLKMTASAPSGDSEKFRLEDKGNIVGFRAMITDKYLCAEAEGKEPMVADRPGLGSWEEFSVVSRDGKLYIKSNTNNNFAAMQSDGTVIPTASAISDTNILTLEILESSHIKYAKEAETLNKLGLFQGMSETEFVPALEDLITREQAIKIILTILGEEGSAKAYKSDSKFTDVSDWAKPYVAYAADKNITNGISETLFGAAENVTGRQLLTFYLRALGYEKKSGTIYRSAPSRSLLVGLLKDAASSYDVERAYLRDELVGISYSALQVKRNGAEKTLMEEMFDKLLLSKNTVRKTGDDYLIAFMESLEPPVTPKGGKIDPRNWVVTDYDESGNANKAIDNDSGSRWDTASPQVGGEWFVVDMKISQPFSKIVLDTTGSKDDSPAGYEIYVSDNGEDWGDPITQGDDPGAAGEISFPLQTKRFVKILQTGQKPDNYWSIHELSIIH